MRLQRIIWVVGCVILAVARQAAAAPFSGGLVIQQETFDPSNPNAPPGYQTTYGANGVITYAIQHGWAQNSDTICSQLKNALGKADGVAKGYTLYNITCTMGDASQATFDASATATGVHIGFVIPNNYLKFTSTQPSACGSECDPTFSVLYDLRFDLDIVPGSGASLTASNARATLPNTPQINGENLIGKLVLPYVQSVIAAQTPNLSYNVTPLVNQNLTTLNAVLSSLAQQHNDISLTVNLAQAPVGGVQPASVLIQMQPSSFPLSLHGAGTIRGVIRWPVALGLPSSHNCSDFGVGATVINGYNQPGQLGIPQQQVATTRAFGLARNGDSYSCQYELSNLPYGVPINVSASVDGWSAVAAGGYIVLTPDGWSGQVTIFSPLTVGAPAHIVSVHMITPQTVQGGLATVPPRRLFVSASRAFALRPTPSPAASGRPTASVLSNPQPLPPGLRASHSLAQMGPVTFIPTTVQNPSGRNLVTGIDFVVQFQVLQ